MGRSIGTELAGCISWIAVFFGTLCLTWNLPRKFVPMFILNEHLSGTSGIKIAICVTVCLLLSVGMSCLVFFAIPKAVNTIKKHLRKNHQGNTDELVSPEDMGCWITMTLPITLPFYFFLIHWLRH